MTSGTIEGRRWANTTATEAELIHLVELAGMLVGSGSWDQYFEEGGSSYSTAERFAFSIVFGTDWGADGLADRDVAEAFWEQFNLDFGGHPNSEFVEDFAIGVLNFLKRVFYIRGEIEAAGMA